MESENFNIYHHRKILTLEALNRFGKITDAAKALGISGRTLHNNIKEFEIKRIGRQGQFYIQQQVKKPLLVA